MSKENKKTISFAYDVTLLFPVLFLVGIGVVMVYSASSALAMKKYGNDYYFLERQLSFALLGIIALVICRHLPFRYYQQLSYVFLFLAVILLFAVQFSGIGYSAGGAQRWLRFLGISFQPSEFARFAMIIYLAYSLSKKRDNIHVFSIGFIPHVAILGLLAVLILLQPDFGSVAILCALTWVMLFVGGVRFTHLLSGLLVAAPVGYFVLFNSEYRMKRILSYLDPWQYPANEGYQIIHSLMAFGTGGIWGTGIGQGYQKLFYLPEPHTDFIFSVIGEELGLWGVLTILVLFLILLWRGVVIAKNTENLFGAFLAIGVTTAVGLQVCVNMGVTLGLLPTKGLTLPFLSYGGSSLLVNMACIGILMNIGATKPT